MTGKHSTEYERVMAHLPKAMESRLNRALCFGREPEWTVSLEGDAFDVYNTSRLIMRTSAQAIYAPDGIRGTIEGAVSVMPEEFRRPLQTKYDGCCARKLAVIADRIGEVLGDRMLMEVRHYRGQIVLEVDAWGMRGKDDNTWPPYTIHLQEDYQWDGEGCLHEWDHPTDLIVRFGLDVDARAMADHILRQIDKDDQLDLYGKE